MVDESMSCVNYDYPFNFILAPNLPKITAVVGLWGWAALSLAVAALIMFYRCSR